MKNYPRYSTNYSAISINLTPPTVISYLDSLRLSQNSMRQWKDLHVYQVFQQPEFTHDEAHEDQEAHAKIKTILEQLETDHVYDYKWGSQFHELQKLVEIHVTAEKNEMFPQIR